MGWTFEVHTRLWAGIFIEICFRYYWTSVLEFFSVFNSIEISVLNIFNLQWYWNFSIEHFQYSIEIRSGIRISTQPRQKYKILTGRNNRFLYTLLLNHTHLFHSATAKKLSRFAKFNTKVQESYAILIFFIFDGKQHPKNIWFHQW